MFCWDENKAESNLAKHKVSFELAGILFDNLLVEIVDNRMQYSETRINAFGKINGRLFVCTYTSRCGWRHIISLRKANSREVKKYG